VLEVWMLGLRHDAASSRYSEKPSSGRCAASEPGDAPPMSADDLFAAALAVRERAYAPYSQYLVGAALRDEAGAIHVGANVENAAYPQSQCAEASAIGVLVAAGGHKVTEALVIADGSLGLPSPCGACRQRLREFAAPETPIHLAGLAGVIRTVTLGDLLPLSFGPEYLGREAVR
jgi:cytidine deaminase